MELALPIIVLGGMYVISNQDNTKPPKKEGFIQNNTTLTKNQVNCCAWVLFLFEKSFNLSTSFFEYLSK